MNQTGKTARVLRGVAAAGLAGAVAFSTAGCKSKSAVAPIVNGNGQTADSGDPALANMAQPYTGGTAGGYGTTGQTQVLGASQSYAPQASGESYGDQEQGSAPIVRGAPYGDTAPAQYPGDGQGYSDTEEAGAQALAETDQAPPPLPEYDQPPAPDPNYLWTPGYWNYGNVGYYWVPGAWCAPPFYGALWTPPFWGFNSGRYLFHRGYWGPHVGYYGGIDYGFGYVGFGYFGGYWHGHDFLYNRAVTNVGPGFRNVYDRTVVYNGVHYGPRPLNRVSYNGGRGGLNVQPRPAELAAAHEAHYAPVAAQRDMRLAAAANHGQAFSANGGRPAEAFAGHSLGNRGAIAAAPREQPFNRVGAANGAGRPGAPGAQPGFNGSRGGAPQARPEFNGNYGGAPAAQPGFNGNRGGAPQARPEFNGNHGEAPAAQPGFNGNRGGAPAAQPSFNGNRGGAPQARPGFNGNRGGAPAAQPGFNGNRGGAPQARPEFNGNHGGAPAAQPGFNGNRGGAPAERAPAPISRPAAPQAPAARPEMTPRPQAAPAPRAPAPAPAPAPRAAPSAAPRGGGGGGGEHGGHH